MTLSGTWAIEFAEGNAPTAGKSVRICMGYKNDTEERSNRNWEQVSFFLPAFEESDWYVRFRSNRDFDGNFCGDHLDDNNLIDDVWKVTDQYWDKDAKRLLLDVRRPL